jgi:hypothetical protein
MFDALVDHEGELLPASELKGKDQIAKAILIGGYVYLQSVGTGLVVAFRPQLVNAATLVGTMREICIRRPRQVVLSYSTGPRPSESLTDVEKALARLEIIIRQAQKDQPRGLKACRVELDAVDRIDGGVMTGLLDAWYQSQHRWSPEFYATLKDASLLDNAVVVRNPARSDTLLIEHWGEKRDLFGSKWIGEARGRQMEDQPYSGLARWVARLYREAIAGNEARLDVVSVAILTEDGARRKKTYSRLLLPWRGEGGDAFALTVNVPDLPRAAKRRRPWEQ